MYRAKIASCLLSGQCPSLLAEAGYYLTCYQHTPKLHYKKCVFVLEGRGGKRRDFPFCTFTFLNFDFRVQEFRISISYEHFNLPPEGGAWLPPSCPLYLGGKVVLLVVCSLLIISSLLP